MRPLSLLAQFLALWVISFHLCAIGAYYLVTWIERRWSRNHP